MNVIALNESMSLSDSHDGAFVNSDYLTDALEISKLAQVGDRFFPMVDRLLELTDLPIRYG